MASSAKEPNGTFKGPISYQQSKKSWTEIIVGGSLKNSSVMSESPSPRPTAGTIAHSIVIDITDVLDKKKAFILDLAAFCEGNTHLWAVSEQIRKDNNRLFAEISDSPIMYNKFLENPSLQLENFAEPFMAYPTLSPQNGNQQLREDMHFNLKRFGNLIDCGYVTGGSGILYAGGGYAVLAVEDGHTNLEHSFSWAYHPIDYSSSSGKLLLDTREHVLAFATWAAMFPYCKYCHSMDHALLHCDLCHEFGHFQRGSPHRNDASSKSGKKRKVSSGQTKTAVLQPSSTLSSSIKSPPQAAADAQAAAAVKASADAV
ncbi:hypothetical protein BD408DRAFT_437064 [Parasitella parasitica]|nr:hypothetical protein BD408DRAFT_437064 [Parasitella parasitica]